MTTKATPKRPMSKRKKIILWVVGVFVVLGAMGAIGEAIDPEGTEAARVEREAQADARTQERAAKASEKSEQEAATASQEAASVEAEAKVASDQKAAQEEADSKVTAKEAEEAKAQEEAAAEKVKADPLSAIADASGVDGIDVYGADGVVFAEFKISDNFTSGMIATVAQGDTVDILKAVRESGYKDYKRIFVQGTFPMSDAYGNASNSIILNAGYDKATVDKINFEGVNQERIWDLKDAGMVHADLQK